MMFVRNSRYVSLTTTPTTTTTLADKLILICVSQHQVLFVWRTRRRFLKERSWRQHKAKHHRSVGLPRVLKYIQNRLCSTLLMRRWHSGPKTLQCVLAKLYPQFVILCFCRNWQLLTNGPNFCLFGVVYSFLVWWVRPFSRTSSALQFLTWPYLTKKLAEMFGASVGPIVFPQHPY